ncbi:conserved Plasmodium protein, unknown function [Plasmodium ovale curtisi]|uniref:Uncharacterized protein n=1 Tax=Plasmodium ovale curtisi TaxID=864141 RepID=A0A1A8VYM0_PLAOA|nr:conserved Plasmodium protein, unknown function [Plasmodium ovale curtisi]
MNLCSPKLRSCKKITRKRLYTFCDEHIYVRNLMDLYIYNYLEAKIVHKKDTYSENVNRYVGKITNHLKINRENPNIVFSLQSILDIYFFNYFEFNYNSKLIFLYNILNTKNNQTCSFSSNGKRVQKKKEEVLNNLCTILLKYDIHYVHEIRKGYIKKFIQLKKENKKDSSFSHEIECSPNCSLVPFYKKTFAEDLVNHAQNVRDVCTIIFIIRNIFCIYKFDYSRLLDSVLSKFYLYFMGTFAKAEQCNSGSNVSMSSQQWRLSRQYPQPQVLPRPTLQQYSPNDGGKLQGAKNIKLRDIIYAFYQLTNLKNSAKNQFIFLKLLAIVNINYKRTDIRGVGNYPNTAITAITAITASQDSTANTHNYLKNVFLSNKDIEQLFFLFNKNCYIKYYFVPLILTQFYLKLFSLDSSIIYFHKLFKRNHKNCILLPVHLCPMTTLTYFEFLNKADVKNFFHTFYQTVCIKYLLKKKTASEKLNYLHETYLNNHLPYVNYIVFYKNVLNKLIARSFQMYISKFERKGRNNIYAKKIMNISYFKYTKNSIYDFSKCKFFYLIYIKRTIKKRRNEKCKKSNFLKHSFKKKTVIKREIPVVTHPKEKRK